jgi:hypothetical protein
MKKAGDRRPSAAVYFSASTADQSVLRQERFRNNRHERAVDEKLCISRVS